MRPFSKRKVRSGSAVMDGAIATGLAVLLWQSAYEYAGKSAISSPLDTLAYGCGLVQTQAFWNNVEATVTAFAYAVAISIALGVTLGLLLGLQRFAGDVAEPILTSIYTIPKITLYPLILLIFGLGLPAKIAFGVIHGVIPIILFTLSGVKNINPVLLRTARVLHLTQVQTIVSVLMPAVVPELLTGVRTGFSLTLLGVLIGEMFASQRGLGFLIINGISLNNVPMTTAVIVIVVVFAVAANSLLLVFDRKGGSGYRLPR